MIFLVKIDFPEIPRSCGMCPCSGTGVCRKWLNVNPKEIGKTRAEDCPILGAIPDEHGTLIDGDLAKARIHKNIVDYCENGSGGYYLAEDAEEEVRLMVEHEAIVPSSKANAILLDSIEWDVDDDSDDEEGDVNLPDSVAIRIINLLDEDELAKSEISNNVDEEDLQDRAVDYLSDYYGFCIFGCHTEMVNLNSVGKDTVIL